LGSEFEEVFQKQLARNHGNHQQARGEALLQLCSLLLFFCSFCSLQLVLDARIRRPFF
jgi:hypothetical protein